MATTQRPDFDVSDAQRLDKRDVRALTETMQALPQSGSVFHVYPEPSDGDEQPDYYVVDTREGRCECADMQHNLPDGDREECKHLARVRFATGERPVPAWVNAQLVDDLLGAQMERSGPRQAATDGGRLAVEGRERFDTERVDGGVLVWDESPDVGRELAGFSDVDDWDAIRSELARRGLGVGSVHQMPEFEPAEVGLDA